MKSRKIPLRMCLGCRNMLPKRDLLRVVQNKEGKVSIDLTGKAPGRGAYICKSTECMSKALKAKSFHKAFELPFEDEALNDLKKEMGDG